MIRHESEGLLGIFQPEAMCHQGGDTYFAFGDQIDCFLRATDLPPDIQNADFSSPQFMNGQGNLVRFGDSDDDELAAGFQQVYALNYRGRVTAALIDGIQQ